MKVKDMLKRFLYGMSEINYVILENIELKEGDEKRTVILNTLDLKEETYKKDSKYGYGNYKVNGFSIKGGAMTLYIQQ